MWRAVLDAYDPDLIIDRAGVSEEYRRSQLDLGRPVVAWAEGEAMVLAGGPFWWSALSGWRPPEQQAAVLELQGLNEHRLGLPLAFRLGHTVLPTAERESAVGGYPWDRVIGAGSLGVQVRPAAGEADERLLRWCTEPSSRIEGFPFDARSAFSVLRLGARQLPLVEAPEVIPGLEFTEPETPRPAEAHYRELLVVGAPDSIADMCLAWNIRAQRHPADPFPVWVAPEWLDDGAVITSLRERMTRGGSLRPLPNPDASWHLVSASISEVDLAKLAAKLGGPATVDTTDRIANYFTPEFRLGATTETIATFRHGVAHVPTPDYRPLGSFRPHDLLAWSVEVDGFAPPVAQWSTYERYGGVSRIARDGITDAIMPSMDPPGALRAIGISSGRGVLDGVAKRAGYSAALSPPGQIGVAVIELLSDLAGLDLLASSRVYALLRGMADIVPRQAVQQRLREILGHNPTASETHALVQALQSEGIGGGQFERQHRTAEQITSVLEVASRVAEDVIRNLISRRLVHRGYEVTCPNCGLRRWYPVDHLSDEHTCDGCRQTEAFPGPVDRLEWRYRLNELVGRAVDHGALPHLLVARQMVRFTHEPVSRFTGLLPGVQLADDLEIDVLAVHAGRVMLAECKSTAKDLTPEKLARIGTAAARLNASRVILATTGSFADMGDLIEEARASVAPSKLETWDEAVLFDGGVYGETSSRQPPKEYLEAIASPTRR